MNETALTQLIDQHIKVTSFHNQFSPRRPRSRLDQTRFRHYPIWSASPVLSVLGFLLSRSVSSLVSAQQTSAPHRKFARTSAPSTRTQYTSARSITTLRSPSSSAVPDSSYMFMANTMFSFSETLHGTSVHARWAVITWSYLPAVMDQ